MSETLKQFLRMIVDRLPVGTPDEQVKEMILKRCTRATPAEAKRWAAFAVKVHQQNRSIYRHIMEGF